MHLYKAKYFESIADKVESANYLAYRQHYANVRGAPDLGRRHETNTWQVLAAGIQP